MAFSPDSGNFTTSNATSTGLTVSHTCASGVNLLVVGIAVRGNQTINSIKYNGVDLTQAVYRLDANDPEGCALYYLVSPASGANNLVVALSGSVLHYVSISGWTADGGTPALDVTASSSNGLGTSGTPNTALSGSVGTMAIDAVGCEANNNPPFSSLGADQTQIHNISSGSYGIGSSYELSPASNEQFDWTEAASATDTWVQCVASFTEAAAAPAGPSAIPDFARAVFPFSPGSDEIIGRGRPGRLGSLGLMRGTGPHPYGGFERAIFPRLHPVFFAGDISIDAPTGELTLTADASAVAEASAPTIGTLALTSNAPTVSEAATPSVGTLTLAGNNNSVLEQLAPSIGTLTLTANDPAVAEALAPSIGTLTLAGNSNPAVVAETPSIGVLTLNADAPTVSTGGGDVTVSPSIGVLTLSADSSPAAVRTTPTIGSLQLQANAPTVAESSSPSAGILSLAANAPAVQENLSPSIGTLTLTANAPNIANRSINVPTGVLTLTANAPTTSGGTSVTPTDKDSRLPFFGLP